MKGPLSLTSAAVLLVLAGSNADATARSIGNTGQFSLSPERPASRHRIAPAGLPVLYDQTAGQSDGFSFLVNSVVSGYASFSTEGADDFVVPSGEAWTLEGLTIPASQLSSSSVPAAGNIRIWSDDGDGHPGVTLVCDGTGTPGTALNVEATWYGTAFDFQLILAASCMLPSGSYWLDYSFIATDTPPSYAYWFINTPVTGQPAQWQNPGGAFRVCPTWDNLPTCFGSSVVASGDWAFRILGTKSSLPDEVFFNGFDPPT